MRHAFAELLGLLALHLGAQLRRLHVEQLRAFDRRVQREALRGERRALAAHLGGLGGAGRPELGDARVDRGELPGELLDDRVGGLAGGGEPAMKQRTILVLQVRRRLPVDRAHVGLRLAQLLRHLGRRLRRGQWGEQGEQRGPDGDQHPAGSGSFGDHSCSL